MPIKYTAVPGDCLAAIAYANGFAIDTIWDDDANAALRKVRDTPFQLVPGDEVTIPDRVPKEVGCATGKRYTFRRRNVPEQLKIQLFDADKKPRANLAYVLIVDGVRSEGTTDGDGRIQQGILPSARSAMLTLGASEVYELDTGYLLPDTEEGGARARLAALGYLVAEEDGEDPAILADALRAFQTDETLTVTGQIDDDTRSRLRQRYGS
jgi:hypothetical protein